MLEQEQTVPPDVEIEDLDSLSSTISEMFPAAPQQHASDNNTSPTSIDDSNDADMDEIDEATPPPSLPKKRKPDADLIKGIRKVYISAAKAKPEPRLPFNAKPAPTTKAAAASFNIGQQVNCPVFGEVSLQQHGQATTITNAAPPVQQSRPRFTTKEKGKQKLIFSEEEEIEEGEVLETSDEETLLENDAIDFGALLFKNLLPEEEQKALSWIAALEIPVSLSERYTDGSLLVLPFSNAEGLELWDERKKAYKGPGDPKAITDMSLAKTFAVVLTGTGSVLGKITTARLLTIFTEASAQRVLRRATISVLGKDSTQSSSEKTAYLIEVGSMEDVRTLLRSPEKPAGNCFFSFSIYTRTEVPELTGVLFNIPVEWSREAISRFISAKTGARPIYVTPKRIRDRPDTKYAFIHAESSRHFEAMLALNNHEPIKGRKLKFERKWSETERNMSQTQATQASKTREYARQQRQQRVGEEQERRNRKAQDAKERSARLEQEEKQRQLEFDRMQKQIRKKLGDFTP